MVDVLSESNWHHTGFGGPSATLPLIGSAFAKVLVRRFEELKFSTAFIVFVGLRGTLVMLAILVVK